jgi:hypothetical protein
VPSTAVNQRGRQAAATPLTLLCGLLEVR